MKSDVANGLAILCVIFLALAAIAGRTTWAKASLVAVGIAAIFGATQLVMFLGSNVSGIGGTVLACLNG
jgi:type IV secretory pathway VirB2 component (pilin)